MKKALRFLGIFGLYTIVSLVGILFGEYVLGHFSGLSSFFNLNNRAFLLFFAILFSLSLITDFFVGLAKRIEERENKRLTAFYAKREKEHNKTREHLKKICNLSLHLIELRVDAVLLKKLFVSTALLYTLFGKDQDPLSILDRREPVSDNKRRPVFSKSFERLLNDILTFIIKRTGCLIKNEDRRILKEYPGYR